MQEKRPPYLWEIIQAYKSKVAVEWIDFVKKNHPNWSAKIWQKNYYERIMRVGELERARLYIRENPDHENQVKGWQDLYEYMGWEKPLGLLSPPPCEQASFTHPSNRASPQGWRARACLADTRM